MTSTIEAWCLSVNSIAANRVLTRARAGRLGQTLGRPLYT